MADNEKNIVILGAAESGVGAALLAQAKGFGVFVSDRGAIQPQYKDKLTRPASSSNKTSIRSPASCKPPR
jgi:UDP-N-acetylmuramoylalanine-D-glutamate ligase